MGAYPGVLASFNPGNLTTKGGLKTALGGNFANNQSLMGGTEYDRGQELGPALSGYQSLANGGTAADNNALTQSVMTPLRGAFNTAKTAATNRVAATGNSAGYGSILGSLARQEGQQSSQAGFDIANQKFQRKMAGLQGLAGLYGVDTSFLNSLGEQQNQLLGIGSGIQARSRGVLGNIAAGVDVAKGFVGKGQSGGLFA